VAALLGVPDAAALAAMGLDSLRKRTHRELLEVARRLGIAGLSRMTKDALAIRLWESIGKDGTAEPPPAEEPERAEDSPLTHKFEVGEHGAAEEPRTIPWSYNMDRVTAMAVDPDRLFAYWEATDDAIAKARPQLGNGGPGAWLNVRVYDTSGLIFDGTNAHSYFDHKIERHDRQWFFQIGKPSSQAVVELGLRSDEGYFVKIARSNRVDFPRRSPASYSDPEWMTVREGGGVEVAGRGMPGGTGGGGGGGAAAGGEPMRFDQIPLWQQLRGGEEVIRFGESREERIQWEEFWRDESGEEHRIVSWESPVMVSSWESGPFNYPVEVPGITTHSFEGALNVFKVEGKTHIVYGPWQVVIRGLGAHYQRQVLARWEVQRSWLAEEGHQVRGVRVVSHEGTGPGSSEQLLLGASELRWRGESEMRLMGGSERMYLGASEKRLMGSSERSFRGASEWLMRGASERRFAGASELRFKGASERMFAGASERLMRGASERRLGASEGRLGASEGRLGGSEHRLEDQQENEGAGQYPEYPETSRRSG
jgi:hypothetical protein